jgi:RNA polymerase-interacting CarD/CdnL/TRCF family regulator
MKFHVGDTVMHWNHGLGQIMAVEEQEVMGASQLYYVVKFETLTAWVPADKLVASRLRRPTPAPAFQGLFTILSGPAQRLPGDRRERKSQLHTRMGDGNAESICHVIRDLSTLEGEKSLNYEDKAVLKWARTMLLAEWGYSLRVTATQAEDSLGALLRQPALSAAAG